ncbi:MAG: DNA recombination protein RmuC [Gammaproteobacteria bacterium]|nr:DNA recombination protein RmuC [Gammaproteobacteria bacterium]
MNTILIISAALFVLMMIVIIVATIIFLRHNNKDDRHLKTMQILQQSIQSAMSDIRSQITMLLNNNADEINKRMDKLTSQTEYKLKEISQQVEKRLTEGFEKTSSIFTDVIKRLAIIDSAQKKLNELSSNVVSLQEVLVDKRSRGAFGEVQLTALINNLLPENNYAMQHTLSNGTRVDCMLFLPEPSGHIAIDSKFPLESYRKINNHKLDAHEQTKAQQQFKQDIKKHLQDIAQKYIIPGETSDGAIMFIPSEAIFAEIHANYVDLIELSHRLHVWMVSPTTMMAVLTTASAVLKDAARRKQVHIIQEHLIGLSKDFARFQKRMDNLARHINQAQTDVEEVHRSSRKITSRFDKIEKVELGDTTKLPDD